MHILLVYLISGPSITPTRFENGGEPMPGVGVGTGGVLYHHRRSTATASSGRGSSEDSSSAGYAGIMEDRLFKPPIPQANGCAPLNRMVCHTHTFFFITPYDKYNSYNS